MNRISDDVIERIIDFYLGDISEREKMDLERWVKETPGQEQCFKQTLKMCQRLRLSSREERAGGMKTRIQEKWREERLKRRRRFVWGVISSAAAVLLLVGIFHVYYTNRKEPVPETLPKISLLESKHGEREAILQFPSGNEVMLGRENDRTVPLAEGIVLKSDSVKNLFPQPESGKDVMTEEYHTVIVPRGGEYNLTLADGTNVWLNSDSKLKFLLHFVGNQRAVYLEGEAFFEVTSDSLKPFVVKTAEANVKVLGTSFNVMNYTDEAKVEVALLKGKVKFEDTRNRQTRALVPGEVVRMDKASTSIVLTKEDVSRVSAWRTGYFYFENMSMEELVVKLERWYQVKFTFASEKVKQMRFTGAVTRYRDLEYVLKMIEKTRDISFVDFGDQIKIYEK